MDAFEKLKTFHDRLLQLAGTLRFNKSDPVDLSRVALYGSLLELAGCMIQLIQHNGRTGVPSVFRAFLEAAVELRNLIRNDAYIEHMYASYLDQWGKVLQEAREGTNPYLASIGTLRDLNAQIADQEKEIGELKARGKQPLNVFERFERADMVKEYRSLYNFLSCDLHSNIRALISRHIERGDNDFKVVFYKDEPIETFLPMLSSTVDLLIEASISVHESFNSGRLAEIQKMCDEKKAS
jgi:hypothetical protein